MDVDRENDGLGFFASTADAMNVDETRDDVEVTDAQQVQPGYGDAGERAVVEVQIEPAERTELFAPSLVEIETDSVTAIASANWMRVDDEAMNLEFNPALVSQIWNEELVGSNFSLRKVMLLDFSQYLERVRERFDRFVSYAPLKYLWPHYNPESAKTDHTLSIVVLLNEKFRERVSGVWNTITVDGAKFSAFFSKALKLLKPPKGSKPNILQIRLYLLSFLIHAFQSLENGVVRGEVLRLTGISIWTCLSEQRRENELARAAHLRKSWNKAERKYDQSSPQKRDQLEFDRRFLSDLIGVYLEVLGSIPAKGSMPLHAVPFCERFVELLIDLESQLPTRRYVNTLLDDLLVLQMSQDSNLAKRGNQFRARESTSIDWGSALERESGSIYVQLLDQLAGCMSSNVDDHTGSAQSESETTIIYHARIKKLQRLCFVKYREHLEDVALSSASVFNNREQVSQFFSHLPGDVLHQLCRDIGIRTEHPFNHEVLDFELIVRTLVNSYCRKTSPHESIQKIPLFPNEVDVFDDSKSPPSSLFSNSHCLPIPKLNLQFLSIDDYLCRNFTLFRLESNYEIRQDIEDAVRRLGPQYNFDAASGESSTILTGWARMAAAVDKVDRLDVIEPNFGETNPSSVRGNVHFSVAKYTDQIRREWDSLRRHDVLFLLTLEVEGEEMAGMIGGPNGSKPAAVPGSVFRRKYGIKHIRGCEIVDILGDDGKSIDDFSLATASLKNRADGERPRISGSHRSFTVAFDEGQYALDASKGVEGLYESFNVVLRRKPQENNFKSVLECMRDLMQSELIVPEWLTDIFLGYGEPSSAQYDKVPNPLKKIDFRDTFLDWNHLIDSFAPRGITIDGGKNSIAPPFVVTFPDSDFETSDSASAKGAELKVQTYNPPNLGPYSTNSSKKNTIRFTPSQVKAIRSGVSPGLTLVVGPPGTGKTDVAVQIISNLYHNFPEQNILLVTHSNQALNQIFEKIVQLDIDPRHVLRLGHGMEEIDSTSDWGKYGRVNSFLEQRMFLLSEVGRLANTLYIYGEHGATCETAGYFFAFHIKSVWSLFSAYFKGREFTAGEVVQRFPFHAFFATAPQPVFPADASASEALTIANGCYKHICGIFEQLDEIRAFELLRNSHDRSNYLLVKEAKIIALTCTYAALKRRELVALGFRYDSVVMEESAQILEIEAFIPLVLQAADPETGRSRLKRVVMIGDHYQLPPVVKNIAFQRYCNVEQSLFARFVRLGVPTVDLDLQGRCRPELADLFRWRYKNLGDLSTVQQMNPDYARGNAGFAFEYQVVNVEDYNGKGETEPIPHFLQNLGEAEYVVAVYQYMRLIGYPASQITILTTYNGQKALIEDVLERRCRWNPLFGLPAKVSTVDKFQGQQNNYILLSLVRTKTVGHLRDVRRLIVALSRARLGLYVFCRRKLYENCYELQPAFVKLMEKPSNGLWLRGKELHAADFARPVGTSGLKKNAKGYWKAVEDAAVFEMDDVAHMGKYVHKMIEEQIEWMKSSRKSIE